MRSTPRIRTLLPVLAFVLGLAQGALPVLRGDAGRGAGPVSAARAPQGRPGDAAPARWRPASVRTQPLPRSHRLWAPARAEAPPDPAADLQRRRFEPRPEPRWAEACERPALPVAAPGDGGLC